MPPDSQAEEAERQAAQERVAAVLRAEQERLDNERREMEVERTRIARRHLAAQYKLDEERLAVEAEQERIARVTAEQVAAEKARAEAEEAARLKAEALRPDCDKLLAVAKAVGAIEIPRVSAAALTSRAQVQDALADASREVRRIVEEMV